MYQCGTNHLTVADLGKLIRDKSKISLTEKAIENINKCREYLDQKIASTHEPIYGVTTGFGALYNRNISDADLEKLQENLVMSHACGFGEEVPAEIVKLMMVLKIQSLSQGKSGVQTVTVERLIDFYNNDVLPVIYQIGSLGASGDLAPLAHLSLPLIGMGEVDYKDERKSASDVLKQLNWDTITLRSKEGLALLNGTQFMGAYGVWCLVHMERLLKFADIIGALSLDAYDGRVEPFDERIQLVRPHKGQIETAAMFRQLLEGSELINRPKKHIQDPYSFRCIPQVHGAAKQAVYSTRDTFETEINSVTDNPIIFPDEDKIISAGNFHGEFLAIAFDTLCIAGAELGSISERRTYQLISGKRELPPFLVAEPGVNSGFMIPQYAAAGAVSQNKQLSTPASVDTIDTSNGQEDHVSMGANAGTKAYRVVENLYSILAIELYTAAQALEFRRPAKTSPRLENFIEQYREKVDYVQNDKIMYPDIQAGIDFLKGFESWGNFN